MGFQRPFLEIFFALATPHEGSEWGDPLVGCRLKFSNFVGSRLKFSIFVGSRLNFSIFVGCRKISVNKYKRLLIINIFLCISPTFQDFDP